MGCSPQGGSRMRWGGDSPPHHVEQDHVHAPPHRGPLNFLDHPRAPIENDRPDQRSGCQTGREPEHLRIVRAAGEANLARANEWVGCREAMHARNSSPKGRTTTGGAAPLSGQSCKES